MILDHSWTTKSKWYFWTIDQGIKKALFYKVFSLFQLVAPAGIEPATRGFSVLCSTDWAMKPNMAVSTGLGPAIFCVTGRRVNQLHHETNMVAGAGFEPTTSGLWAQRATWLLYPAILWRRKRDSNPCAACTTSRFSRPVPSTRLGYSSVGA